MITRDTVLLTLDRSPQNLEYWMSEVLEITAPRMQGRIKADLMKIVSEQRGSSIAQFFTIEKMEIDTTNLSSEVTGELHPIVANKAISRETRKTRTSGEWGTGVSVRIDSEGGCTINK